MKIYVAHSSGFDYQSELYQPLRELMSEEREFIFPHDREVIDKTDSIIKDCDLFLAEVSYPSTGMGIEMGWADAAGVPIVCVYKKGSSVSPALRCMTDNFVEYSNLEDLKAKVDKLVKS